MNKAELREAAIEHAWNTGNLEYLVRPYQRKVYRLIKKAFKEKWPLVMVVCCRKFGKTYLLTLVELEELLTKKYAQLHYYGEDTAKLKSRVFPQLKQLLRECPWAEGEPRRPVFKGAGKDRGMDTFVSPTNDTTMEFYPANEDARGGNPSGAGLDEAAFIAKLYDLIHGTIGPTFSQTGGTCVIITTPSLSTSHYSHELFDNLLKKGRAIRGTYEDMIVPAGEKKQWEHQPTQEDFEELKESFRDKITGELKPQWEREYMAEFVNDTKLAVLPTWDSKKHVKSVEWWNENIRAHPAYKHCLKFVGIDYGTKHFTSLGFYTYFKPLNILIKERTVVLKGENVIVKTVARLYYQHKLELWGMPEAQHPTMVIAECRDTIINQSLRAEHNIPIKAVKKSKTKSPMTSAMVELITNDQFIIIDTSDNNVSIRSCEGVIWQSEEDRGSRFADGDSLGHFDTVDVDCYTHWEARWLYPYVIQLAQPDSSTEHYDKNTYNPVPGEKPPVGNPNLLPRPPQQPGMINNTNNSLNKVTSLGDLFDTLQFGI